MTSTYFFCLSGSENYFMPIIDHEASLLTMAYPFSTLLTESYSIGNRIVPFLSIIPHREFFDTGAYCPVNMGILSYSIGMTRFPLLSIHPYFWPDFTQAKPSLKTPINSYCGNSRTVSPAVLIYIFWPSIDAAASVSLKSDKY